MNFKKGKYKNILKICILMFVSSFVINCNVATELIVDDPMIEGGFNKSIFSQSDYYKFSAEPYSLYAIVWDSASEGSGNYSASVTVTVSNTDPNSGSTDAEIVLIDQWSGLYLDNIENGYSTLRLVATGDSFTDYYISVNCNLCSGNYGIQVVSMSKTITLGAAPVEDTITQRTPSVDSSLMTYSLPVSSGVVYNVRVNDAADGTGAYLQDVYHFVTFNDLIDISLIDTGALNSYTSPDTFSVNANSFPDSIYINSVNNVLIWVMLNTYSTSATGYSIEVY